MYNHTSFQGAKAGPGYFRRPDALGSDFGARLQEHEFPEQKMERLQNEAELLKPVEQAKLLLSLCDQLKLNERLVEQDDIVGRLRLMQQVERKLHEVWEYFSNVKESYQGARLSTTDDAPGSEEKRLAERVAAALNALNVQDSVEQAKFITTTESGTVRSAVRTDSMDYTIYQQQAAKAVNLVMEYLERHHLEIIIQGKTHLAKYTQPVVSFRNHEHRLALEGILNAFTKTEATSVYQESPEADSKRWYQELKHRRRMDEYHVAQRHDRIPKMPVTAAWQMQGDIERLSVQDKQKLLDSIAKRLRVEFMPSAA